MSTIQAHVSAINACNQRGGRMLSLVDLLDAGTVDLPLAAYLAAAMRSGASLLVGARPGGAGKTAVMCALLNFLPDRTAIRAVDSPDVLSSAERDPEPGGTCYVAHEIGSGPYYAYVWGKEAQAFFRLVSQRHVIASNLHADTLAETQAQLCRQNPVDPAHLAAVTLKVYLEISRGTGFSVRRRVNAVYESNGTADRLVWALEEGGRFTRQAASSVVSPCDEKTYAAFLESLVRRDVRAIEAVRRALLVHTGQP
jgi:hypothetical protein